MVRGCRQGGADPSDYLAWSASYILLVDCNGRGDDPRDHGGRGTQDYEPSCSLRPPFPSTHAVSGRPHSRDALRTATCPKTCTRRAWRLRGEEYQKGFKLNLLILIDLLWCREGGRTPTTLRSADFESLKNTVSL